MKDYRQPTSSWHLYGTSQRQSGITLTFLWCYHHYAHLLTYLLTRASEIKDWWVAVSACVRTVVRYLIIRTCPKWAGRSRDTLLTNEINTKAATRDVLNSYSWLIHYFLHTGYVEYWMLYTCLLSSVHHWISDISYSLSLYSLRFVFTFFSYIFHFTSDNGTRYE